MFLKLKRNLFSDGLVLGLMELVKALFIKNSVFFSDKQNLMASVFLTSGFSLTYSPGLLVSMN
jgi:hypothetical protein